MECKRHNDTRARREVVGQMLEYVANGHYYWTAAQLTSFAEESAGKRSASLDAVVAAIQGPGGVSTVDYFARVEENLRSGRVRMIFVLEESSYELRSVVEFLNRQMEDSEVLLVEIRLYETGGQRIAIPVLFGYTERARAIKKSPAANASGEARRTWDESSFLEDAVTKIPQQAIEAIKMLLSSALEHDWGIKWGTGRANGSISVRLPGVARRSLFSIYSNGTLVLNFGWLNENDVELAARSRLAEFSIATFGLTLPEQWEQKYIPLASEAWGAKMGQLVGFLASLVPLSEKAAVLVAMNDGQELGGILRRRVRFVGVPFQVGTLPEDFPQTRSPDEGGLGDCVFANDRRVIPLWANLDHLKALARNPAIDIQFRPDVRRRSAFGEERGDGFLDPLPLQVVECHRGNSLWSGKDDGDVPLRL